MTRLDKQVDLSYLEEWLRPGVVDHEVLIIGAGFGGLGAGIAMKRLGIEDFLILDRDTGVGGTWHTNTYPGVAVDIPSALYSFSFEPNPDWGRAYAPGEELKGYAEHVTDKYGLREHVRLGVEVRGLTWDETDQRWTAHVEGGDDLTARLVVVATGILSQPKKPEIAGLDEFTGTIIHTARWSREETLAGQRVAIVGTGATAVQALPEVAKVAESVTVFQRTPIWVTPKPDLPIPKAVRKLYRYVPASQRVTRIAAAVLMEYIAAGLLYFDQAPWILRSLEAFSKAHLRLQVSDPDLREKLTPDYNFFCKRPTFSNTYFRCYERENVELVTAGIERLDATGVVARDGSRYDVDTVVLATGFTLQEEGNFPAFPVVGRNGIEQGAHWREHGYESYAGLTASGFPNLFSMNSPYSFTGLSYFYQAEAQMAHMNRVITEMRHRHCVTFEVKPHAQARFVAQMERAAQHSVWRAGSCSTANSYYFNSRGETRLGRLEATLLAQWKDRHFPLGDYRFDLPTDVAARGPNLTAADAS
jgi:cation diffusion facilitator CzcD-associated flavoprotein CzcO